MKGFVKTTQDQGRWYTSSYERDTIGLPCRRTPKLMLRPATNVRGHAEAYVRACDKCQRFSNIIRQPTEELTPMTAPWPFAQWGLDIMGPFLIVIRQLKFLVVGIDYFIKWVEVEVLATITKKNIRSFF